MIQVKIRRTIQQLIMAHAQAAYPEEVCGFLAGRDHLLDHHYLIENMLHSRTAYEMEPRQQLAAMLHIEAAGMELLAAYHSHPHGPAWPSSTDIAYAYYPTLWQLIVSLENRAQPVMRAFTIVNGQVEELDLRIE